MNFDLYIALGKVTGAVVSGGLGIAGILVDFKDVKGRLKKSGSAVLVGIVVSAGIAASCSLAESYKSRRDSAEQAARVERLLSSIERATTPITQLSASYWVELPRSIKEVDNFYEQANNDIRSNISTINSMDVLKRDYKGYKAIAIGPNGYPQTVEIPFGSQAWPTASDKSISDAAAYFGLFIHICQTPKGRNDFSAVIGGKNSCDLIAWSINSPKNNSLDVVLDRKSIEISGREDFPKSLWHSSGRVISVSDLRGSQLIFMLPPTSGLPEEFRKYDDRIKDEIINGSTLRVINLRFADGREIFIGRSKLTTWTTKYGPAYEIVLPKDESEWQDLCPEC